MGYRRGHYRRGHYRRNANGSRSWVSSSYVRGHSYDDGSGCGGCLSLVLIGWLLSGGASAILSGIAEAISFILRVLFYIGGGCALLWSIVTLIRWFVNKPPRARQTIDSYENICFSEEERHIAETTENLVPDIKWQRIIYKTHRINQFLPVILKWHGENINIEPVDYFNYKSVPVADVVECVQQMNEMGMLDDNHRFVESCRLQLKALGECVYQRIKKSVPDDAQAILYYRKRFNRFEVEYDPERTREIRKAIVNINLMAFDDVYGKSVQQPISVKPRCIEKVDYSQRQHDAPFVMSERMQKRMSVSFTASGGLSNKHSTGISKLP